MRLRAVCFTVLLSMALPACAGGGGSGAPANGSERKTSLQLIAEALDRREIDPDTATLYRVYSVFDASKLPAQYRGGEPIRDGTPVIRDARSRYDSLRPEMQEKLKPYLFPKGRP